MCLSRNLLPEAGQGYTSHYDKISLGLSLQVLAYRFARLNASTDVENQDKLGRQKQTNTGFPKGLVVFHRICKKTAAI
jgi:hypothetical protein